MRGRPLVAAYGGILPINGVWLAVVTNHCNVGGAASRWFRPGRHRPRAPAAVYVWLSAMAKNQARAARPMPGNARVRPLIAAHLEIRRAFCLRLSPSKNVVMNGGLAARVAAEHAAGGALVLKLVVGSKSAIVRLMPQ